MSLLLHFFHSISQHSGVFSSHNKMLTYDKYEGSASSKELYFNIPLFSKASLKFWCIVQMQTLCLPFSLGRIHSLGLNSVLNPILFTGNFSLNYKCASLNVKSTNFLQCFSFTPFILTFTVSCIQGIVLHISSLW